MLKLELHSQEEQEAFGRQLAQILPANAVVLLKGELGAGKTTLVRGVLRGLGWHGNVKSPTYTIVEPYEFNATHLYHFDLYRLSDPEELEYLGMREMLDNGLLFFEWPERGMGLLPQADLTVAIEHLPLGRTLTLSTNNKKLLSKMERMIREVSE